MDPQDGPGGKTPDDDALDDQSELSSESLLRQSRLEMGAAVDAAPVELPAEPPTSIAPDSQQHLPGPTYQFSEPSAPPIPAPPPISQPPIPAIPTAPATPAGPPVAPLQSAATASPPLLPAAASPTAVGPASTAGTTPTPPPFIRSDGQPATPRGLSGSQPPPPRSQPLAPIAPKKKNNLKWVIPVAVLAGLIAIGIVAGPREPNEAEQAITEALDEVGLDIEDVTFRLSATEQRCLQREGVTEEAVLEAYSNSGAASAASQEAMLNATLICAPRIVDNEVWIDQMIGSFTVGLGTDLTRPEMKCIVRYSIDRNPSQPADVLIGNDEIGIVEATEECLSEQTLAILRGEPGAGPQVYGDDESLDQLFDLCTDGRDEACDILFITSSVDSEYELQAIDCAGRGLESTFFCTAGLDDNNADGWADDSSIGMIDAVDACINGDMLSCDLIFSVSELDSTFLDLATTCGNRRVLVADTCIQQYGLTAE